MNKIALRAEFWAAVLAVGLGMGAGAIALATPGDAYAALGVALLLGATAAMVVRPFAYAQDVAPVGAAVVFALVVMARAASEDLDIGQDGLLPAAVAGAACGGIWALVRLHGRALTALDGELDTRARVIRELSRFDLDTGALQPRFGHQVLTEEIARSRRYHHTLTLMMVGVDDWAQREAELGSREAARLRRRLADLVTATVRPTDKVVQHEAAVFALILPETPVQGATVLAERMADRIQAETQVPVRTGLAEFPEDAVTPDDLINEAEQALEFARLSQLRVASRALLS